MFLLYLDEAGTHNSKYFVLCGAAVFERKTHWISTTLDQIQRKYLPDVTEDVELHATVIRAGREEPWCQLDQQTRYRMLDEIYDVIRQDQITLFASAIEKNWLDDEKDAYVWSFEGIVNRFDRFLRDKYKDEGEAQRGIIIIAESQYKSRLEELCNKIREFGTVWGEAYNLAEIPMFIKASKSRLLQVADFCANAIIGKYESGYSRQFDKIAHQFYEYDGIIRGLAHYTRDNRCMCPSCISRRNAGEKNPPRDTNSGTQTRFPENG